MGEVVQPRISLPNFFSLASRIIFLSVVGFLVSAIFPGFLVAEGAGFCIYSDSRGVIKEAADLSAVPDQYRNTVRCLSRNVSRPMPPPDEIKVGSSVRRERISAPLGTAEILWPRSVENVFRNPPTRVVVDSMLAARRALDRGDFPSNLISVGMSWKIVFMDENVPAEQIPADLVSNCHPAWFVPVGNLYLVAQRIAKGCSGGEVKREDDVVEAQLGAVMLHELGHAIEYQLLGGLAADRMRAEGFATWFEQYASQFSEVIPKGSLKKFYHSLLVDEGPNLGNKEFNGDINSYARASVPFLVIERRRGVKGIVSVYQKMVERKCSFLEAVNLALGWSSSTLYREMILYLSQS